MKTGDIVYLCEDIFRKFRDLHGWMKSSDNLYQDHVKSASIENRFVLVAFSIEAYESDAFIVFQNEIVDGDIVSSCPGRTFDKFVDNENFVHSCWAEMKDSINRKSIISKKDFIYTKSAMPFRRNSFVVKLNKLTIIRG